MAYELNDNYKWWDSTINKWRIASDTTYDTVVGVNYPSGTDKIVYFGPVPVSVITADYLTAKGGLVTYSTIPIELAVGGDGEVLTADSAEATGLKWSTNGAGDMLKSVYDTDDDGRVDVAEGINDGTYTATAANLSDAISKKHTQNTDTQFNNGVTEVQVKALTDYPVANNNWGNQQGGMIFDGVNDYVSIPDDDNLSFVDSPFSIEAFVKLTDATSANIVSKGTGPSGTREYILSTDTADKLIFVLFNPGSATGNYIGRIYNTSLQDGKWYHIVGTSDGTTSASGIKLYVQAINVDGTNFNSGTFTGMNNLNVPLHFGYYAYTNVFSKVQSAYIRLFNRALTQAEVTKLYGNGLGGELEFADKGASQTALTSGTLTIGKRYIIDTFETGDDFTNAATVESGTINTDGCVFICEATTPTTWTNSSSLRQLGNVGEWKNFGRIGVLDASGNGLHGTTSGSPISLDAELGKEIYKDVKLAMTTGEYTLTSIVPKGYKIKSIYFKNTAANAVTGGIKIGTASGGTQVVVAEAIGASAESVCTLATDFFSSTASQTLYVGAVTAWNSASVNLIFTMEKVAL